MSQALRRGLALEVALEGLVEALDLAAGLRVVGAGVFGLDAEAVEFGFEHDATSTGCAAEDGGVVAQDLAG